MKLKLKNVLCNQISWKSLVLSVHVKQVLQLLTVITCLPSGTGVTMPYRATVLSVDNTRPL